VHYMDLERRTVKMQTQQSERNGERGREKGERERGREGGPQQDRTDWQRRDYRKNKSSKGVPHGCAQR